LKRPFKSLQLLHHTPIEKMGNANGYESIPGSSPQTKSNTIVKVVGILLALVLAFSYIPTLNGLLWTANCYLGTRVSGFQVLETDRYEEWFAPDATMTLAQTGTFEGPKQMKEYVDFTQAIYFDLYESLDRETSMRVASKDQCLLVLAIENKAQVKEEYSLTENAECAVATVGIKLNYTVGMFGFGFNIKSLDLFYPSKFLQVLFSDLVGGPKATDYICDTVLRDNCAEVYEKNGLDEDSCKTMYNELPATDDFGCLNDKTKGCRILHSAFAEFNDEHCPHMSFIPMEDYSGELWCQEPCHVKVEDLWDDEEMAFLEKFSDDNGWGEDMYTTCEPVNVD
jgi:hypothetical protein